MRFNTGITFRSLTLALALTGTLAATQEASAQWPRRNNNAALAVGVVGALAAGAIIAGSQSRYYGQPAYGQPAPAYGGDPDCSYERQQVWNGNRYVWRNVQVCD